MRSPAIRFGTPPRWNASPMPARTKGTVEIRRADADAFEPAGHVDLFFSHLDGDRAPEDLPEGNFVFSDNFKILLDGFADNPEC